MKTKVRWIILAVILMSALLIVFLVVRENQRKESIYRQADQAAQTGDALQAYALFQSIKGYRDAENRAAALTAQDIRLPFQAAEKGDIVRFGRWEQDNHPDNGPEEIEWIVLDKIDGQLLLLSCACLEGMPYHDTPFDPVTWETCSLRGWLNRDFLASAFTDTEQNMIPAVRLTNDDHSLVETEGGRDTEDRVFLLSETDTVIYLNDALAQDSIGKAPATESAVAGGLQTDDEGIAPWWLRSPGMYEWVAQFVDQNGAPYINGANVDMENYCGVRPAIWLDAKGAQP